MCESKKCSNENLESSSPREELLISIYLRPILRVWIGKGSADAEQSGQTGGWLRVAFRSHSAKKIIPRTDEMSNKFLHICFSFSNATKLDLS